jgi:6-pyruvoyltetrahydropterin/6-carboxytetrahydropterin synthase
MPSAFAITTTTAFPAAHALRMYDGKLETLHEHTWRVKVTVASAELDSIGVVMDFHDLTGRLEAILSTLRNRSLNDLPAFAVANPSAENVAVFIARALAIPLPAVLESVEVWETDENSAIFRAGP